MDVEKRMLTSDRLNVAGWQERSVVNGPGDRFVLWLQGCRLRCPGCINPHMLPVVPRHLLSVTEVEEKVLSTPGIEGVTYSGGEPMLQAAALAELSERLRSKGLTVVCYTGYLWEQVRESAEPGIRQLLSQIDILIDGPFDQSQAAPLLWRGSRNQRVLFLTGVYREWQDRIEQSHRAMELTVGRGHLKATGTWDAEFAARLERLLGEG